MKVTIRRSLTWTQVVSEADYVDHEADHVGMSHEEIREYEEAQELGDVIESLMVAAEDKVDYTLKTAVEFGP